MPPVELKEGSVMSKSPPHTQVAKSSALFPTSQLSEMGQAVVLEPDFLNVNLGSASH